MLAGADIQERNIFNSQGIDNYVAVNVARMIVTVGMCADNRLMPCEMLLAKLLAESLGAVNRQPTLNAVAWVKTDYVVMIFSVSLTSVFAVLEIGFHTGDCEVIIAAI